MRSHARVDALVKDLPVHGEAHDERGVAVRADVQALVLAGVGEPLLEELERPDDAAGVVGVDERGALGVAGREQVVESLRPEFLGQARVALAHGVVRLVPGGEVHVLQGGAHVQARAAADDRRAPLAHQAVDAGVRLALVAGDRVRLARIGNVDAQKRYASLVGRRLGRADVHTTVDLHGVGRDHLGAQAHGQLVGKRRLAAGGGPHHRDDVTPQPVRTRQGSPSDTRCAPPRRAPAGCCR